MGEADKSYADQMAAEALLKAYGWSVTPPIYILIMRIPPHPPHAWEIK